MTSTFRGVFLTSENPARTATFYRDVAGLALERIGNEAEYVYWKLDEHGMQLAIHDAQKFAGYAHPSQRQSNLTHLYFKLSSRTEFLARLSQLGIEPESSDDIVVTVVDPDGRRVMFGTA
jgi:predicted enzyme related to lactoylglutathione lyase